MAKIRYESTFALPDAYQQQAAEARRRRRMAEMLAQQAYQPGDIQNAPIPAAAPLVQGLQAFLTARAARKSDEAEESAKETASREAREFLNTLTRPREDFDKTMDLKEVLQIGTPELVDGQLKYPDTFTAAPNLQMIPQAGPQVQLGRKPEDDQVYMPAPVSRFTATGRETDPKRMAAMLANPQFKSGFTDEQLLEQRRNLALEGMLTSENPLVQKVAGAIYPTLQPEKAKLQIGNIDPAKFTPASIAAALNSGNVGDLQAITEPVDRIGKPSPGDFTSASLAKYNKTGDFNDLVRVPKPTGGGRDGAVGRGQQGPAFALSNGKIIQSTFDPVTGQYMYQSETGRMPVPSDAKPTTAGAASGLSEKQYITYRQEAFDHRKGLERLDSYFQTVGDTNVGLERYADAISAKAKNLFGKTLKPEELALQVAAGKLNGLLGLFRVDIVGPGVLTEYDAGRVIEALGGDLSALQDKERVRILLEQLYQDKKDRLEFLAEELGRSDSVRGGKPITASDLPSNLGSPNKVQEVDY